MTTLNHPIVEQLRRQRTAAFEQLYEATFPRVARLVQRGGGDLADAEDVFHDALLLFYEQVLDGRLALRGSPSAYLAGIARHLWLRRCRDKPRLVDLEAAGPLPEEAPEEEPVRRHALFRYLEAAGRRCLDLLQAFYYQRLSMREIAEEFGFGSERSATVQKYKCLEKVREEAGKGVMAVGELVS